MTDFPVVLASLIPLLPLLAAAWVALGMVAGWNQGESGEPQTARAALWAILLSFLLLLTIDIYALIWSVPGEVILSPWFHSGDYQIWVSLLLDRLSLVMATLVSFISMLVTRFSIHYLHRENGFQRFMLVLSLFNAAMLIIVLAGSAVLAFVGWELAGVSSYLLIGYAWERPIANANAIRAFITNRIGDAGFILGIVFSFLWLNSNEWQNMFNAVETYRENSLYLGFILVGFLLAALVKSAQLPFSDWISRALEGPTPSTAVFYGALMVHAGVYLILRLEPMLVHTPALLLLLAGVGALTTLYAYLTGLTQSDIKSVLIFSTLTQIGLILIWIGLGWFDLALVHLVAHAIWRSYQFLSAPSWLQQVQRHTRPVPKWLATKRGLHTAALQRFWLDGIASWLLINPTRSIAHDARIFDEQILYRIMGKPTRAGWLPTLTHWEASQRDGRVQQSSVGTGSGVLGKLTESVASALHWFEEHLVLSSGSSNLQRVIHFLGRYLEKIDFLLEQPRYLILIIIATLVVALS